MRSGSIEALGKFSANVVVILALVIHLSLFALVVIGMKAGFGFEQSVALLRSLPSAMAYLFGV